MPVPLEQLKRLKEATNPSHRLDAQQCEYLVGAGLLSPDLKPTTRGLELLAREGLNSWEEDQERRLDLHSDHDPE